MSERYYPQLSIFLDETLVKLNKAKLSSSLSFVDDVVQKTGSEGDQLFGISMDRLVFQSLLQVTAKILEAGGFEENFENILYVLENTHFGVRTNSIAKNLSPSATAPVIVQSYLPCLVTSLPSKSKRNNLLLGFYQIISGFEVQMAELKKKAAEQAKPHTEAQDVSPKNKNDAVIKDLKTKVDLLEKLLRQTSAELKKLKEKEGFTDDLGLGLERATVQSIDFKEQRVRVRTEKDEQWELPFLELPGLPSLGQKLVVKIGEGQLKASWFYEGSLKGWTFAVAKILYVSEDAYKMRFFSRKTYQWKRRNLTGEKELSRGDLVIVFLAGDVPVRIHPVEGPNPEQIIARVQEDLAQRFIMQDSYEDVG